MTGFLRANRGVDSEIDDTFTIMLQYGERQRNLLVTVKTAVVTHLKDQLKYLVRGTKGSYLKVRLRLLFFFLCLSLFFLLFDKKPSKKIE